MEHHVKFCKATYGIPAGFYRVVGEYLAEMNFLTQLQWEVAAGHKSLSECFDEQRYTLELFPQITAIYFCLDFDGKECWVVNRFSMLISADSLEYEGEGFRKPEPGMLKLAMWQYDISPQRTFYVGNRPEDGEAAIESWCAVYGCGYLARSLLVILPFLLPLFLPGSHLGIGGLQLSPISIS